MEAEQAPRIGEVRIRGNKITRDAWIRDTVEIYPGQRLREADLRRAEVMLFLRFHSRFAWWRGERPRLKLLPQEEPSRYWDIEIEFHERD
jgi:hypothetical protein